MRQQTGGLVTILSALADFIVVERDNRDFRS